MSRSIATPRLVLVTRPAADAEATLAALAARGHAGLSVPMQRIVMLAAKNLPSAAALLLTSRNTVRALAGTHALFTLPCYCVGDSTAALARATGFSRATSADGDARDLARLVIRHCDPKSGPLLLPGAVGAGQQLAGLLRAAGFRLHRRTVYRPLPLASLSSTAHDALAGGRIGWALFHAGTAAAAFAVAVRRAGLADSLRDVEALAISAAAAQQLGSLPWRRTSWPARPTEAAMLALLPTPTTRRRRHAARP